MASTFWNVPGNAADRPHRHLKGCGVEFPKVIVEHPELPKQLVAALPKSIPYPDADAPAGGINSNLTPLQCFAIECFIGSAVEGGYARNLYEGTETLKRKRTAYDFLAGLKTKRGNTVTPRYFAIKEMLGPELARTRNDGPKGFAAQFEAALLDLKSKSPREDIPTHADRLRKLLGKEVKTQLAENNIDLRSAVGNFLAIRSALVPVEGNLVRGITGGELGLPKGQLPALGEPIPFSSIKGTVVSTNPAEFLKDTVDYVMGKVNSSHPRHGGKDAYVLIYPPGTVEGVSIKSLPGDLVTVVEKHLATNVGVDGAEYRDPSVVVSKREVLASPKEDLVVRGFYRRRSNPALIYVVMGEKGAAALGEHWED